METVESTNFELDVELRSMTKLAVKVYDGAVEAWIPKSLIVDPPLDDINDLEVGDSFTLIIPEWKAKQEGLI